MIYLGFITFIGRAWDIIMGLCRKKSQNLSPWPRAAVERSASVYKEQKDWKCKISSSALTSTVLMQGKKIWHTPGVNHWDYTFLFIIFFLWCTMWSLVAVLNFPKNGVFFTLGAYSSCPTWARDPQKSSKRYISGLFEKSVPNMVTYLCKVLSKLHFPEGDTY